MKSLAETLRELRALKDTAEEVGREKKDADAAFKQHQGRAIQRMEAEEAESFRTTGYLYSVVTKVKGQVEDRTRYIRHELENDPAILEFLAKWAPGGVIEPDLDDPAEFEADFFEAITGTSTVAYKEKQDVMNQQARSHTDDGAPLPPGLTFRPDPYISMTKS